MIGRRLLRIYPQLPLVRNTALGIAIMSYDGTLNFGLLSDYDALPDLDDLAAALRDAIAELAAAAGVARAARRSRVGH
jgi:diacylglycerol O-acyltransferase